LPKAWVRQRKREHYYRKAKQEAYRSRASFKLLQAVQKFCFMRLGDVVVDLGAAPGGWLQIVRQVVGEKGFVLGVDLSEIEPLGYPNVHTIVADIIEPETAKRIRAILPRAPDVVVSDASPSVSGVWEVDHARQVELAECSLQIAVSVLKTNGCFFVKVFQGEMFNWFLEKMRGNFALVRIFKPKASRAESAEIYVLGLGCKSKA